MSVALVKYTYQRSFRFPLLIPFSISLLLPPLPLFLPRYISIMTLPICWFAALRQFFQVASAPEVVLPRLLPRSTVASRSQPHRFAPLFAPQAQNIVLPGTIVAVCAIPLNVGFNQLFIYGVGSWKGLGFVGSPIASTMTATVQLLLYYLYW